MTDRTKNTNPDIGPNSRYRLSLSKGRRAEGGGSDGTWFCPGTYSKLHRE